MKKFHYRSFPISPVGVDVAEKAYELFYDHEWTAADITQAMNYPDHRSVGSVLAGLRNAGVAEIVGGKRGHRYGGKRNPTIWKLTAAFIAYMNRRCDQGDEPVCA
jgi:hypothetical protein